MSEYEKKRIAILKELFGESVAGRLLAAEARDGVLELSIDEYVAFVDRMNDPASPKVALRRLVRVEVTA